MYTHPAHIPVEFAMAVYRVMHNTADATDWETLDRYLDVALQWVRQILESNGTTGPALERELEWWQRELFK